MSGLVLVALLFASSTPASAAPDRQVTPDKGQESGDIVVMARSDRKIGRTEAASEGAVSGTELLTRPLLRTSELAEAVPGMIAVQHSGGGKAAQYLIRGYNLDHGTDFSIAVDNMPFNLRSHAHGHGYLDLNGLIPETVDHISYRKGPYRAGDGDFSFVGAASVDTKDRFDQPFATMTVGSYGYRRLAGGGSFDAGSGSMLLASELSANNGPWELAEHLRHVSVFGKYSQETSLGTLRASLSIYDASWRPTEQIPVRAIGTILDDRFGTLDPYLRGSTNREVLNIGITGQEWTLTAYAQHYKFDLLSNFTFFLDDPVRGDELEQTEDRWTFGGRVARRISLTDRLGLTLGLDAQTDRIDGLGLYHTEQGRRLETRGLVDATETSVSGYAEANWKPVDRVNVLAGARIDHFALHTTARGGDATSGSAQDTIVTPKLGANITLTPSLALYANYGQGFHSNAIRGIIATQDATPVFARATGYEVGARFERGPFNLSLTHWWSRSSSELIYSGDDGTVSPTGPSHRRGFELVGNVRATHWLTIDGVFATNHARFVDAPGADRIPNALESAGELGLTATLDAFNAAVRVRYLGPHSLVEDNSVRSPATTVVNMRVGRQFGPVTVDVELLNLFDTARADADYYYASRLPGEPLGGVEGIHSRTVEPRMLRIGATVRI